ncbi:hypothetical protein LO772_00740 [Yinghuangia sp. ASG 101]|uniref:hypothetical protein n=1 Tax=Yinghuangia sp. ASG 101 TaxID=2896848 RepID=UPI001E55B377|nr:hypothetical protein [Yinghuangia sp. ASG 101]UGQ12171.1 hypothetical protein LO772_00740 [Yinghuangia sp. ASG 101]
MLSLNSDATPARSLRTSQGDANTLALTATDTDARWSVARAGDTIAWTGTTHAAATVTVSATAVDLYLLALRRMSADDARLTIHGDRKVLDTWLDRTVF